MSGALAALAGGNTKSDSEAVTGIAAVALPAGAGMGFAVSRAELTDVGVAGSSGALIALCFRRRDTRLLWTGVDPGAGTGVGSAGTGTTSAPTARLAVIAVSGKSFGAGTSALLSDAGAAAAVSGATCCAGVTIFRFSAVAFPWFSALPKSPPGIPNPGRSNFKLRIKAWSRNEMNSAWPRRGRRDGKFLLIRLLERIPRTVQ